ncbi:hypothetical protein OIU79_027117 [Salix purpurea]|uniref:Uncharacterized protein n=1 Tax=Salix purpurea TaxID=77065 RepID=A0A9Q1A1G7_SALPP|nr:hypothetical protein OIU79_027117 [Salix purpurea]
MRSTEKIKLQYLKNLLSRESKSGVTLKELFKSTREIEKEARSCYAEPIHVGVEDFVRLLYLQHDLILVENQIPWLVLENLFNKTAAKQPIRAKEGEPEPEKETTLAQLALKFFANIFSSKLPNTDTPSNGTKHLLDLLRNWWVESSGNDEDVETPYDGTKHLLDRLRNCLVKSSGNDEDVETEWETMPSATDLVDAGIELKVRDSEHRSILDVKFKNGSLEMPSLIIQETTEVIIRNLISYEQCSPQCDDKITSYAKRQRNTSTSFISMLA